MFEAHYSRWRQVLVGAGAIAFVDPALDPPQSWLLRKTGVSDRLGYGHVVLTVAGTDGRYDDLLAALAQHAPDKQA